jgi:hypothetical protein
MTVSTAEKNDILSLDTYRNQKYNVLVPTTTMTQISPFHKLRVEEVRIDPNPDAGDVFKVGSKYTGKDNSGESKYEDVLSLSKTALMKISNAAGIVWNWSETKPISATRDYVLYQAVGAFWKTSGEWLPLKCTKEIDLQVIEDETYEANLEKAKKYAGSRYASDKEKLGNMTPEEWAKAQTKSNMIQWRKNKLMRAETGAMLRVIRDLLSMKQQYSPAELQKPFVVPHVDFSPDYSDPEVRKMVMQHGLQATSDLFGRSAAPQAQLQGSTQHYAFDKDNFDEDASGSYDSSDEDTIEGEYTQEDTIQGQHSDPVSQPEQNTAPDNTDSDPEIFCFADGCGKKLSPAEINYCTANYDQFACMKHQKQLKKVTT